MRILVDKKKTSHNVPQHSIEVTLDKKYKEFSEALKRVAEKAEAIALDTLLVAVSSTIANLLHPQPLAFYESAWLAFVAINFNVNGGVVFALPEPKYFGVVITGVAKNGKEIAVTLDAKFNEGEEKIIMWEYKKVLGREFRAGRLAMKLKEIVMFFGKGKKNKLSLVVFVFEAQKEPALIDTPFVALKSLDILREIFKDAIEANVKYKALENKPDERTGTKEMSRSIEENRGASVIVTQEALEVAYNRALHRGREAPTS